MKANVLLYAAAAIMVPVGLAAGYASWLTQQSPDHTGSVEERKRPAKVTSAPAERPPSPVVYERAVDEVVFGWLDAAPGAGSDVFPDQPFRVTAVASSTGVERLDVDLDRDGRLDEQWTIGDGVVRAVSVEDDGVFGPKMSWTGRGWREVQVQTRGSGSRIETDPNVLIDALVLGFVGRSLDGGQELDLLASLPVGIDVFQDEGHETVNRAHVDLDRDGNLDQIWEMSGRDVRRRMSPTDDGSYPVAQRREDRGWVDDAVDGGE